MNGPAPIRGLGPAGLFRRDVGRALAACRFDPRLPVVVLGLSLTVHLSQVLAREDGFGGMTILWVVVQVLTLGFLGAERLWFVAADRRERSDGADILHFSKVLWRRYFGLAVYTLFVSTVAAIPVGLVVGLVALVEPSGVDVAVRIGSMVAFFLIWCALTFATVVLAFTDIPAGDAVRHSVRVIRDEWPSSAWYVFAAPLTFQVVAVILLGSFSAWLGAALVVVSAVARLVVMGATALFYADRYVTITAAPD